MERLLWRCHEFGGVWVFDSSWFALASTAQRQFRIGVGLQLVLWGDGGNIYSDMLENSRGTAVNAGWFCWLLCTSCCVSFYCAMCVPFAWRQAHALRHHGGYGPEGQFLRSQTCGDSTGAVLGQGDMAVVVASGVGGQTAQKTVEIPQVQFVVQVYMPADNCGDSHRCSSWTVLTRLSLRNDRWLVQLSMPTAGGVSDSFIVKVFEV